MTVKPKPQANKTMATLLDAAEITEMAPPRRGSTEIANNVAAKGETTVRVPEAANAVLL